MRILFFVKENQKKKKEKTRSNANPLGKGRSQNNTAPAAFTVITVVKRWPRTIVSACIIVTPAAFFSCIFCPHSISVLRPLLAPFCLLLFQLCLSLPPFFLQFCYCSSVFPIVVLQAIPGRSCWRGRAGGRVGVAIEGSRIYIEMSKVLKG